jgi:hypothetical protein
MHLNDIQMSVISAEILILFPLIPHFDPLVLISRSPIRFTISSLENPLQSEDLCNKYKIKQIVLKYLQGTRGEQQLTELEFVGHLHLVIIDFHLLLPPTLNDFVKKFRIAKPRLPLVLAPHHAPPGLSAPDPILGVKPEETPEEMEKLLEEATLPSLEDALEAQVRFIICIFLLSFVLYYKIWNFYPSKRAMLQLTAHFPFLLIMLTLSSDYILSDYSFL